MIQPIKLDSIPTDQNLPLWLQIKAQLEVIDRREKKLYEQEQIEASDRTANKILPTASWLVSRNNWAELWDFLSEKGAIAVATPQKRVRVCTRPYTKGAKKQTRVNSESIKHKLKESLPLILTDKWNTVDGIVQNFYKIHPEVRFKRFDDYLNGFEKQGLCFALREEGDKLVYYANCQATEWEHCWLPQFRAYKIAVQHGYNLSPDYFSNRAFQYARNPTSKAEFYRKYGLEFREKVPDGEINICKWRRLEE